MHIVSGPGRTVATLHINFRGLKKDSPGESHRPEARIDMTGVPDPFAARKWASRCAFGERMQVDCVCDIICECTGRENAARRFMA